MGNSNTAAHEAFISDHLVIIQLVLNARPPPNLLIENINDMSPLAYASPKVMNHFNEEYRLKDYKNRIEKAKKYVRNKKK